MNADARIISKYIVCMRRQLCTFIDWVRGQHAICQTHARTDLLTEALKDGDDLEFLPPGKIGGV